MEYPRTRFGRGDHQRSGQEVEVVRSENETSVEQDHRLIFGGFRTANLVLDNIEAHLTRTEDTAR